MSVSLYEHIRQYLAYDIYPFHMPGHKRNPLFLPQEGLSLDMTEIGGMDNLHEPEGVIRETQSYIASLYGADESFLLVNGSSCGIQAAVCAVSAEQREPVLVAARNMHLSVYYGMALSGAYPVYIQPEYTSDGLYGGVCPGRVAEAVSGLRKKNGALAFACIITSPTYEGFVSDIQAIADVVHAYGGVLIVDEAHGAHFPFHPYFPASALQWGADIVVNSLHKTLPALSQTAVLHVKGRLVNRERLRFYLKAFQTTSPSYILMASAGHMLQMLKEEPAYFETYVNRLQMFRKLTGGITDKPIRLMGRERVGADAVFDMDAGKLLFDTCSALNAAEIGRLMAERYKIQMEMANARNVLAMTSVADTDEGFNRLAKAVEELNDTLPVAVKKPVQEPGAKPVIVLSPQEAVQCETVTVCWEQALGRTAGSFVTPYPPGVPLLVPGERITERVYALVKSRGMDSGGVKVIAL